MTAIKRTNPDGPAVTAPATDRLDSWKEIARYLNRDVRTAQRWEKTDELPVHRHLSAKHGSVFAHREREYFATKFLSVNEVASL